MSKVMMTITSPEGEPTVEGIIQRYDLDWDDIDRSFGVVAIDPADHAYTILVKSGAAAKIQPDQDWDISGPYSNPKIEPFGMA